MDAELKSKLRHELRVENKMLGEKGLRRCRICGEVKSLEFFYGKKSMPLGKINICINCQLKKQDEYRLNKGMTPQNDLSKAIRRENHCLINQKLKRCGICHEIKSLDEYGYNKQKKAYNTYCKECNQKTYHRGRYTKTTRGEESINLMHENAILMNMGLKRCKLCGEVLSIDEYHKSTTGKQSHCKKCWTIHVREQRNVKKPLSDYVIQIKNENQYLIKEGLRHCNKCDTVLPLSSFSVNGKNKSGKTQYMAWCKRCRAENQKNKIREQMKGELKKCRRCGALLPRSEFNDRKLVCKMCESNY